MRQKELRVPVKVVLRIGWVHVETNQLQVHTHCTNDALAQLVASVEVA